MPTGGGVHPINFPRRSTNRMSVPEYRDRFRRCILAEKCLCQISRQHFNTRCNKQRNDEQGDQAESKSLCHKDHFLVILGLGRALKFHRKIKNALQVQGNPRDAGVADPEAGDRFDQKHISANLAIAVCVKLEAEILTNFTHSGSKLQSLRPPFGVRLERSFAVASFRDASRLSETVQGRHRPSPSTAQQ